MSKSQYDIVKKYRKKRRGVLTIKNMVLAIAIMFGAMSIGYSYWNTTLNIRGTVIANENYFITYSITYDLDGGSFYDTPISVYTPETATFNLPNPVKPGYRFIGWTDGTTQSEEVLQNSIQLELNTTYIAGTQGSNTIYIRGTSGEVMASFVTYQGRPRCMVYVYDSSNSIAQYSTNGSTWTTISNWFSTTTIDNVTIYYQFFTLSVGGQNTESGIPTYDGSFEDFTAAIVETEQYVYHNPWTVIQGSEGDIDVMALWEPATTYTITFNANTGTGTMTDQIIVSGDTENLHLNTFTKTDYEFIGWATSSNGSVIYSNGQSISPSANLNLFAKWGRAVTVTFHSNGGTGTMNPQTFGQGTAQSINANTFTKSGYQFMGWATSSNGSVVYTDEQSITLYNDTDLYAIWGNTITFDSNGGTGTMNKQEFELGDPITLTTNTFTRSGYVFRGWATSSSATSSSATTADYQDGETFTPSSSMTLYAIWKQTFTVTFNSNRGSGTMTSQTFVEGESQAIKSNTFTRNRYRFSGWATSSNGSVVYTNEQEITVTANMTLYAKWTRN